MDPQLQTPPLVSHSFRMLKPRGLLWVCTPTSLSTPPSKARTPGPGKAPRF